MNLKDGSRDLFLANIRKFEPSTHQIKFYTVTVISAYSVFNDKDEEGRSRNTF
jgi:hypothetical protein